MTADLPARAQDGDGQVFGQLVDPYRRELQVYCARYEALELISLAFITALQLPPRQRAALILRDVLGFHAAETARLLDTSKESVTSPLKRHRRRWSAGGEGQRVGSLRRRAATG